MAEMKELNLLPFTKELKNPYWSYLYAYNIRTIRDIFIYCNYKGQIEEKAVYKDIKELRIPPPKDKWINPKRKRPERLILEYIHATEYLGLIKRENDTILPNFDEFEDEKRIIIEEGKGRLFNPSEVSPPFAEREKKALLTIVLNYERAKDFLRWFLDFSEFPDIWSFNINDFRKEAQPIFISGKMEKGKKGSSILKRAVDSKTWRIPTEKPDDYTRIVSYLFPNWFRELGVIDKVYVFPEFSEDKKLWHMYYPIKISEVEFLKKDISKILRDIFLKDRSQKMVSIWMPHLLYILTRKFYCPVSAIKKGIEKLYKEDFSHFYLDRTSLQVMKKHSRDRYKESYIKVGGFYRSNLKVIEGEKNYDGRE